MSWNRFGIMLSGLLLSSGCLMHNVDKDPKAPIELPDAFSADGNAAALDPGPFWLSFNDPELTALVDQALTHNLQLRQGWARLEQAQAGSRGAMAGLFPRIDASLGASRSKSAPRIFPNQTGGVQEIPGVESDNYSISAPVSYELDVWGRVRSGMLAANQDTLAFRADVEAIAMTIAASVTERWFDIIEQRANTTLLGEQTAVNERTLALVKLRFEDNDATLSDIYQQEQQVQALQVQLNLIHTGEQAAEQQLAILLGKSPRSIVGPSRVSLPDPPPLPEMGIPASLLEMRPDVRAAKARVVAADYRVAQAIANRLPQLTLSGAIGFNSPDIGKLLQSFIWNIAGSINASIWDGGLAYAEIDRSRALVDERLAAYGQAMLTAMVEVEGALLQERQQLQRIALLDKQVQTANRGLSAARRRYEAGIGTYLATLTALRSQQSAEQALLAARRQLLSQRIQIYRALGSRWTTRLKPPEKLDADKRDDRSKDVEDTQ